MVMDAFYNVMLHKSCLPQKGTRKGVYSPFVNGLTPKYMLTHKDLVAEYSVVRQ